MRPEANNVIASYAERADTLVERFEALDTAEVLAPVLDLLPDAPARVLDVGAGTGRDAAWLSRQGHAVSAVEPTAELRREGQRRHSESIKWFDDTLPRLETLTDRRFDVILVNGVLHHLSDTECTAALCRFAELSVPDALLVISLREGPQGNGGLVVRLDTDAEIERAGRAEFELTKRVAAFSHQADNRDAGVTWTWLAFRRNAS